MWLNKGRAGCSHPLFCGRNSGELHSDYRGAFHKKGIKSYIESPTNQQFVIVDKAQKATLAKDFIFEEELTLDAEHDVIRFCTGWNTTQDEVDALIRAIEAL